MMMQALKKYGWAFIGLFAMLISVYFLSRQNISLNEIAGRLQNLSWHHWVLAGFFTLVAYAALAGYDRIALRHLGHHQNISWAFITLCSFTTYALSHFIGASAFSGALVRYRAYSSKGLSGAEIALLVAFCSFTFILGTLLLMGLVLALRPDLIFLVYGGFSLHFARGIGLFLLALVGLYVLGSLLRLKPLKIKKFSLTYPRPQIVLQQLIIGPLELLGAAGIIYAVLPDAGNPGFITVLGVFLASFTATLLINAPAGGVGVLELIFIKGMPGMNETDVLAALAVFHLLYQIIPLIISLFIVAAFESHQFFWRRKIRAYRRRMEEEKAARRQQEAEAEAAGLAAATADAVPAEPAKAAAPAAEADAAAEPVPAEQTAETAPQKAKTAPPAA